MYTFTHMHISFWSYKKWWLFIVSPFVKMVVRSSDVPVFDLSQDGACPHAVGYWQTPCCYTQIAKHTYRIHKIQAFKTESCKCDYTICTIFSYSLNRQEIKTLPNLPKSDFACVGPTCCRQPCGRALAAQPGGKRAPLLGLWHGEKEKDKQKNETG